MTILKHCVYLLIGLTFVACTSRTPEMQAVSDAAEALGGADRLQTVKTIVIEGEGTQFNLGQDVVPGVSGQTFTVTEYKRAIDVPAGRARTELTRTPNFAYFMGRAAQIQSKASMERLVTTSPPMAQRHGRRTLRQTTGVQNCCAIRLLPCARRSIQQAASPTFVPKTASRLWDVTTKDGRAFTLALDSSTKLPARVTTLANNRQAGPGRRRRPLRKAA